MASVREEQLKDIYEDTRDLDVDIASAHFQEEKKKHSAFVNETLESFADHWLRSEAMEREQKLDAPIPTAEELWAAVRAWEPDPLQPTSNIALRQNLGLLDPRSFAPVPLGKLRGEIMCALEPEICLGPDDEIYFPRRQNFELSASNDVVTWAIDYAYGHPSGNDQYCTTHTATEDDTLRRFISLGYVLMMIDGDWIKTGHVLVLDADHKRQCHPWFVLVTEWKTDDENYILEFETEFIKPAKRVKYNDRNALGVLPGNLNRTPIARLTYHQGHIPEGEEKFVTHFGEDFNFEFDRRMGKFATEHRSPWGPDLAEVMPWWWDHVKSEEVCFTQDGKECMRFNPATRAYDGHRKVLQGQIGNIVEDLIGPVSIHSCLENVHLEPSGPSSD